MQGLLRLPLIFFFIASLIGLLLRWHAYQPVQGLVYPYWLHAHSHLMFLGWVFNALSIAFVYRFIPMEEQSRFRIWLIVLNVLVACMFISFPLQGYGVYSIAISTLHTLVVIRYYVLFIRYTRNQSVKLPIRFARLSMLFFLVSAAGPFALGLLIAKGLGHTQWYNLAVYYYLHFQYNGVFTFGVLALVYKLFEDKGLMIHQRQATIFRKLMPIACILSYSLSVIWAHAVPVVVSIGFLAALLQLIAVVYFIKSLPAINAIRPSCSLQGNMLMGMALCAFGLKILLQALSAFPSIANLAYEVRPYVIAYLHLVLIGFISFFVLAWYIETFCWRPSLKMLFLLVLSFVISELSLAGTIWIPPSLLLLSQVAASLLMAISLGWILSGIRIKAVS